MSKFDKLKQQRKDTQVAFLELDIRGRNDIFVIDGTPLTVRFNPPSLTIIAESKFITTNVLRHSDTYKNKILNKQVEPEEGQSVVNQAVKELAEKLTATEEGQAEQINTIIGIGKEYLLNQAIDCYYKDDGEEIEYRKVVFVENAKLAEQVEKDNPDTEVYTINEVSEKEIFDCAMELFSAVPTKNIPNIAFETPASAAAGLGIETVGLQTSEVGGEKSIPANSVAQFPRDLRKLAVEDVPESGSGSVQS